MRPTRTIAAIGAALVAIVLLAGCGSEAHDGAPAARTEPGKTLEASAADLDGTDWQLVSGVPTVEGWPITLWFGPGTVGGTAACNRYGGDARVDDGALVQTEIFTTEMSCGPAVDASNNAFLDALLAVSTVRFDGAALVLSGGGFELRFEPLPPVRDSQLVDVRWRLETLIDGDTASTPRGEPATLELRSNGSLAATTGCRTLSRTWTVTGSSIGTPSLSADGECPDDLRDQDQHVISVIEGEMTAMIEGAQLTLTVRGGRSLIYGVIDD